MNVYGFHTYRCGVLYLGRTRTTWGRALRRSARPPSKNDADEESSPHILYVNHRDGIKQHLKDANEVYKDLRELGI